MTRLRPAATIRRWLVLHLLALASLTGTAGVPSAHALQPGFLELTAQGPDSWLVLWRVPDVNGRPMQILPVLPEGCTPADSPAVRFDGNAWSAVWLATCPGGLAGGTVRIDGLERTATDVLVRSEMAAGQSGTLRLTASAPAASLPEVLSRSEVVTTYGALGVTHILTGIDHLVFVLALILLTRGTRRLIATVTAFTLGHSLSLAAAALGWIVMPSPPVEAVIALSIMFLARELVRPAGPREDMIEAYPWIVALGFGLLHGLGFAGALLDIGLPATEVPLALVMFNLGVEAGQLLFIAGVLVLWALLHRLRPALAQTLTRRGETGNRALGLIIGSVSAVWFVERLAAF